MWRRVARWL